jgi:hypothetical protein
MSDLDPTRELARQTWRVRIARYISLEALHETVGGLDSDDETNEETQSL